MGRGRVHGHLRKRGGESAEQVEDEIPASTVPNLGASGAIAAVMGGFLVTYPRDKIRSLLVIFVFIRTAYIPAALLVGVWFLMQLVNLGAVAQNPQPSGGVAYAAHVGGFIFGAVTVRLFEGQRRPL
jgi:membrane associated rhomboid family serine protease